jgi:hypothetical protein
MDGLEGLVHENAGMPPLSGCQCLFFAADELLSSQKSFLCFWRAARQYWLLHHTNYFRSRHLTRVVSCRIGRHRDAGTWSNYSRSLRTIFLAIKCPPVNEMHIMPRSNQSHGFFGHYPGLSKPIIHAKYPYIIWSPKCRQKPEDQAKVLIPSSTG